MSESLRRSTRRNAKKPSSYSVGDFVEVTRNEKKVKGRLVYKLTEGPTANPRWLVAFDDKPAWKEEEVYEKAFGKHLSKFEENPTSNKNIIRSRHKSKKSIKSDPSENISTSSEAEETRPMPDPKKKAVTFTDNSPTISEVELSPKSRKDRDRVSAREQRSLRRQAMVEDVVPQHPVLSSTGKRPRSTPPPPGNVSKKARKDGEVIKVPMLTGTLILYRGLNRRAEFIRKF